MIADVKRLREINVLVDEAVKATPSSLFGEYSMIFADPHISNRFTAFIFKSINSIVDNQIVVQNVLFLLLSSLSIKSPVKEVFKQNFLPIIFYYFSFKIKEKLISIKLGWGRFNKIKKGNTIRESKQSIKISV